MQKEFLKSNSRRKIAFAVTFFLVLLVVMFLPAKMVPFLPQISEKRALANLPNIPDTLRKYKVFPKNLEKFVSDNFELRAPLITLNSWLKYRIFRTATSPKVLVGKNGWLFYHREEEMADFRQQIVLPQAELRNWRIILEERRDWLKQNGIDFLVAIPPAKQKIYPEYLPEYYGRLGNNTKLDQFFAYLKRESDLSIVDLRNQLLAEKEKAPVYYVTDTHWNFRGGFVGYREIAKAWPRYFPPQKILKLSELRSSPKTWSTNLPQMMGLSEIETADFFVPPSGFRAQFKKLDTPQLKQMADRGITVKISYIDDPALPKAVVLGDSFIGWDKYYLKEHFSRVVFLNLWVAKDHRETFPAHLIKEEQPDVVIMQFLENRLQTNVLPSRLAHPRYSPNRLGVRIARLKKLFNQAESANPGGAFKLDLIKETRIRKVEKRGRIWKEINLGLLPNGETNIWIAKMTVKASRSMPLRMAGRGELDLCRKLNEIRQTGVYQGTNVVFLCVSKVKVQDHFLVQIPEDAGEIDFIDVALKPHPDVLSESD